MKKIALWAVLIVLFVAFYQFFSARPGAPVTSAASATWLVPTIVVVFVLFFGVFYVRARRWMAANDLGVAHLNAGEHLQAKEQFEVAGKRAINKVQTAVAQYNLGITLGAMGDYDGAIRELEKVEKSQGLKQFSAAYHTPLPNHLALAYAFRGDLASAKKWLKVGDERRGNQPMNFTLMPEVVVLCRDGHPAAAANLVSARWRHAEALSVRMFKLLKLVEALALHLDNPTANAQRIVEALGATRPMDPEALDAVTRHWPELRQFVSAHPPQAAAAA